MKKVKNNMKVIIVNPPFKRKAIREGRCEQRAESYQYLMVPISLPSIAAMLQAKYDVKIIDCMTEDVSFEQLKKILKEEKPDLVIVNVATFSFNSDIQVATMCKKLKILSAAIGIHITTLPDYALKLSDFSFLIRGEPELTCLKLVGALAKKDKKKNLKKIDGISYKEKGKIFHNKPRKPVQDLDKLPFPARELLHNEKYIMPLTHEPYTLIIPSRGCPYSCIFCTAHKYYGKKQRYRSVKNIVEEIKEIVYENKVYHIGMWSDTFTLNKKLVLEFCKAIKKENLHLKFSWYCNSRVDCLDEEMIKEMASANCKVMTLGVESLNKDILKNIKKGITPEQVEKTIKLCRKYSIETQTHIIFGLPGETKKTVNETIKGILRMKPDYAQFYCAIPFPGTEFYDYVEKNNLITTKNWDKYEINQAIVSYPNFSDKQIQNAMRKAYKRFYFRPAYVFKTFKGFSIKKWPSLILQSFSFIKGWVFSSK